MENWYGEKTAQSLTMTLAIGILMLSQTGILQGQSVGLEFGVAGVENFSATTNFGVSLSWNLNKQLAASLSYSGWLGTDNNYVRDYNDPSAWTDNGSYYGNNGLNAMLWYKPYQSGKFSSFIGAGSGQYERIRLDRENNRSSWYDGSMSAGLLLRYEVSPRFSPYIKGLISAPTPALQPRWGFLNLGFDFKAF
jgi:hypothetical protein